MINRDRHAYKSALIETFATISGPAFHVTAELPPTSSRASLEDCLRGWGARIDRFYLGRNWQSRPERRMQGVVFFEQRPYHHAHMIVRPPRGASPLHFLLNARFWFLPHPEKAFEPFFRNPVTRRGRMLIQRIGPTLSDLERVIGYAAKDSEFRSVDSFDWKFVADLSRR